MIGHNSESRQEQNAEEGFQNPVSSSLKENISSVKKIFEACDDVVYHYTEFNNRPGCLIYLSEMVHNQTMVDIETGLSSFADTGDSKQSVSAFIRKRFSYSNLKEMNTIQSAAEQILTGNTALFVERN